MTLFQIILIAIFIPVLFILALGTWFIYQISSKFYTLELGKRVADKTPKEEERIIELEVEKATITLESYEAETRLKTKTVESDSNDSLDKLRELRREKCQ